MVMLQVFWQFALGLLLVVVLMLVALAILRVAERPLTKAFDWFYSKTKAGKKFNAQIEQMERETYESSARREAEMASLERRVQKVARDINELLADGHIGQPTDDEGRVMPPSNVRSLPVKQESPSERDEWTHVDR